jgi:hypothetical protein
MRRPGKAVGEYGPVVAIGRVQLLLGEATSALLQGLGLGEGALHDACDVGEGGRVLELDAPEVGACKVSVLELDVPEVGVLEVGVRELGAPEVGT